MLTGLVLACNNQPKKNDCSKYPGHHLVADYIVEHQYLGEERFEKYLANESEYYNKQIELNTNQIEDTLFVKFLDLGGNATLECVAIDETDNLINIINYETNGLKEISIKEYSYKIINKNKYKLGKIYFRNSK